MLSVKKHVTGGLRRRLLLVLVKDSPGSLVGRLVGSGGTQATWQGRHHPATVLEHRPSHVGIVVAVLRLVLGVEAVVDSVSEVVVVTMMTVSDTDSAGQLADRGPHLRESLPTGGLARQAWDW